MAGISSLAILMISIGVLSCAAGCDHRAPEPTQPKPAGSNGFAIVASCDTQGWIEPCGCASGQSGGLSRRATLADELAGDRELLLMSAGGAASGGTPYDVEKFHAIVKGEAAMGYHVHNIGATELMVKLPAPSRVTFVSSNVRGLDPIVRRSVILEKCGWRILVLGVVSPTLVPADWKKNVEPPEQAILRTLDTAEQSDVVAVLAYMNRDELHQLAAGLPEVDLIIGGKTSQSIAPIQVGRTLLTAVSNKGKFLARIIAEPSDDGRLPIKWSADLHEVSDALTENQSQIANLKEFRERLRRLDFAAAETSFVRPLLSSEGQGQDRFAGSSQCQSCHEEDFDHWNSSTHSHAWATLEEVGAEVDSSCQRCHTTGFGLAGGFVKRSDPLSAERRSVGCESCHGPSSAHVMDNSIRTTWQASEACLACHDHENSPHFQYDSYWADIEHGTSEPTSGTGESNE